MRFGFACGLPVPGQKFVKLVGLRGAAHHAIENVDEIRLGVEAIQFRCVKKRS